MLHDLRWHSTQFIFSSHVAALQWSRYRCHLLIRFICSSNFPSSHEWTSWNNIHTFLSLALSRFFLTLYPMMLMLMLTPLLLLSLFVIFRSPFFHSVFSLCCSAPFYTPAQLIVSIARSCVICFLFSVFFILFRSMHRLNLHIFTPVFSFVHTLPVFCCAKADCGAGG